MQTTARVLRMTAGSARSAGFVLGFGYDGREMHANVATSDPADFSRLSEAIITKADLVSHPNQHAAIQGISNAIFENAPTCLPPIVTASNGLGINDLRRSIVEACHLSR